MSTIILLNKPYGTLSQFTDSDNRTTLKDYIDIKDVYPAGRLDKDSEGLLILTDDGQLQHRITNPDTKMKKTYWVQVEGKPDEKALDKLRKGVQLNDGVTLPAEANFFHEPDIWPRNPPIRYRANIPTQWLQIRIHEGRNRQVRRMTAAIGFPTLRIIRYAIGHWTVDGLIPGEWEKVELTN